MDSTFPTDPRMLSGVRHNRAEAWRDFEQRYAPFIHGYARSLGLLGDDLDEAVQESLIGVFRKLVGVPDSYDREKWPFRIWLRGVIRNKVRDQFRKRRREIPVSLLRDELNAAEIADTQSSDLDSAFEEQWRQHVLALALEEVARIVDPVMYQAFQLRALDGMKTSAVANLLGVKQTYVHLAKHRVTRRVVELAQQIAAREAKELI